MIAPVVLSRTAKEILQSVSVLSEHSVPDQRVWRLRGVPASEAQRLALVAEFQAQHPMDFQFQQQLWVKRGPAVMSHIDTLNGGRVVRQLYLGAENTVLPSPSPARPVGLTINTGSANSISSPASAPPPTINPSDPTIASIRQFVRRIFLEHGVINKQRVKELLLRAKERDFPLANGPAFLFAVNEECQTFTPSTFVLRSVDREVDRWRPEVLRSAVEMQVFEAKALLQHVAQRAATDREARGLPPAEGESAAAIPPSVATRIVSEIAEYKQGERLWHVKSGNIA
jgi:hypothetical protein